MQAEQADFGEVLKILNDAGVRFVVIGGLALVGHGSNYVTQDIDVAFARDRTNLQAVAVALATISPRPRHFPPELPFIWDAQTVAGLTNMTLDTAAGSVDLLAEPAGVDSFEGLWSRSSEVEIYGQNARIASIDDLIRMKVAAGRDKDLAHVYELEALKKLIAEQKADEQSE